MSNTELIAEAREIADSTEGWLNSLPPYERNSGDRDFDRRTLTSLRATADALEAAEQTITRVRAYAKTRVVAELDEDGDPLFSDDYADGTNGARSDVLRLLAAATVLA